MKLLHSCVLYVENIKQGSNRALKDKLAGFKDLITHDNTIIRLHEKLAKRWPAIRSREVAAGVKVSLLISAVADGPKSVALYGGAHKRGRRSRLARGSRIGYCSWILVFTNIRSSPASVRTEDTS